MTLTVLTPSGPEVSHDDAGEPPLAEAAVSLVEPRGPLTDEKMSNGFSETALNFTPMGSTLPDADFTSDNSPPLVSSRVEFEQIVPPNTPIDDAAALRFLQRMFNVSSSNRTALEMVQLRELANQEDLIQEMEHRSIDDVGTPLCGTNAAAPSSSTLGTSNATGAYPPPGGTTNAGGSILRAWESLLCSRRALDTLPKHVRKFYVDISRHQQEPFSFTSTSSQAYANNSARYHVRSRLPQRGASLFHSPPHNPNVSSSPPTPFPVKQEGTLPSTSQQFDDEAKLLLPANQLRCTMNKSRTTKVMTQGVATGSLSSNCGQQDFDGLGETHKKRQRHSESGETMVKHAAAAHDMSIESSPCPKRSLGSPKASMAPPLLETANPAEKQLGTSDSSLITTHSAVETFEEQDHPTTNHLAAETPVVVCSPADGPSPSISVRRRRGSKPVRVSATAATPSEESIPEATTEPQQFQATADIIRKVSRASTGLSRRQPRGEQQQPLQRLPANSETTELVSKPSDTEALSTAARGGRTKRRSTLVRRRSRGTSLGTPVNDGASGA